MLFPSVTALPATHAHKHKTTTTHTHHPPCLSYVPSISLVPFLNSSPSEAYEPALSFPSLLYKYPQDPLRLFPPLTPSPPRISLHIMAHPSSADTNPTSSPNPSPSMQPPLQRQTSSQPQNCKLRFLMVNGESFHMIVPASSTIEHIKQKVIDDRPPGAFLFLLFA